MVKVGIQGLWMFSLIWTQITAPIKNEISKTMPMESMPNWDNSVRYCLRYILTLSGREKVRPISIMYFPKLSNQ